MNSGSSAILASTDGTGGALDATITNASSSGTAISATTAGLGDAIDARITNGSSTGDGDLCDHRRFGPGGVRSADQRLVAAAVYGDSFNSGGPGVQGVSGNSGVAGVLGLVQRAPGWRAICVQHLPGRVRFVRPGTGHGVEGQINNTASAAIGVFGTTNGTGSAVVGQITNAASSSVAVGGVSNGTGAAFGGLAVGAGPAISGQVWGTGSAVTASIVNSSNSQPAVAASTGGTGPAVKGTATGTGSRGGVFAGVAAQLQLTPGTGTTHPTAGQAGDLYADKTLRLWFCTIGGTTATWKQIQLT